MARNASPHREAPLRARDLMSRDGAQALAAELNEYWRKEGFPKAEFWVVSALSEKRRGGARPDAGEASERVGLMFCVRSNLVNGLPPR